MSASACGTASSEQDLGVPGIPDAGTFSKAQYAAHITQLRARLRKLGLGAMAVRVADPFVVIGDGPIAELEEGASTVRRVADRLEQGFFARRPTRIIDVYLFTDALSYEAGVETLTEERPSTVYGFYSSSRRAMFMNISTGGGTLVHEIVHPYVEADFPNAPPWLNEGLGSLFEQSGERDDHIVGLTNWRLAGLQRAIRADAVPPFRSLTALGHGAFYDDHSGVHYAQSRYLMYYLQEHGLLREFYRRFRAERGEDPTGFQTLTAVLGESDMTAFQNRWEAYVAKLRFPAE
ncbi:MAG: hypothetical protein H0T42_34690 [Deltaproteobacteria bacterium]|nr:hypothetical protein [Deltaproteobacteria bacterium]